MPTAANPDSLAEAVPRDDEVLCFPASIAQESFFYLEALNLHNAPFNVAVRFRLEGTLDISRLKHAFAAVIARHEILRTRFEEEDGDLRQLVLPAAEMSFDFHDISLLPPEARDERLSALGLAEATKPFSLAEAPLMRALLVKITEQESILHVTVHHAVADGWSIGILTRELAVFYEASALGKPPALEPLPIQYADFTIWQREFLESPECVKQLDFWKRNLEGFSEPGLVTDHPRPLVKKWNGHIVSQLLPTELSRKLEGIAHKNGASLFHAFLAVFKILLRRYTESDDITLGIPVVGRDRAEMEPLIGTFINSLLVRTELSARDSFETVLCHVRDATIAAIANQDIPFEALVREFKPRRDSGRNPLFQINFTYQRDFVKPETFAGVQLTALPSLSPGAIFDLHFFMVEREGVWRASCEYNTDLFEEATARRMLGHFLTLMESAAAHPLTAINELPWVPEDEANQILEWSHATTEFPRQATLGTLFLETAARHPKKIAIRQGDRAVTYGELCGYASRLAQTLRGQDVLTGQSVAILSSRSPEMIGGLLAILLAGGAYIPLDPNHPEERIRFLMEDADARILLAPSSLSHFPDSISQNVIQLEPIGSTGGGATASSAPHDLTAEHPACILHTSDSTGTPKGVVIPHRAIARLVRDANFMDFRPEETFLQAAPLGFDAAAFEIWGALLNGGTLVLLDARSSGLINISQAVRQQGVTTLWLTAELFQVVIDEHLSDLQSLHQLIIVGEGLSVAHARRACASLPHTRLIHGYGPTENTTLTTTHLLTAENLQSAPASIGGPIANTSVYILDEDGQLSPIGVPGEIFVGGEGLALGYLGNPGLTAERFIPNPLPGRGDETLFRTGDRGRWQEGGTIEFLGRRDRQTKLRGVRIEPAETEAAILSHPAITACHVGIRGRVAENKALVAWVCLKAGASLDRQELSDALTRKLPPFLCPDAIMVLENLPLTPNGKVDADALPDPEAETRTRTTPPTTPTEKQLAKIWCELLGVASVGRDDNFFYLGGHSLLGMRLFSRIQRDLAVSLPVATLLKAPTLRALALIVDAKDGNQESAPREDYAVLATMQRNGHLPPLFCVHGADGGIIFYRSLVTRLRPDRPVVAIESRALHANLESPPQSVAGLAKSYVGLIQQRQSQGPYFLCGYSFGGLVAYEMARILLSEGETVAFLGLFDAMNPTAPHPKYTLPERILRFWNTRLDASAWQRLHQMLSHGFRRALARLSPRHPPSPQTTDPSDFYFGERISATHRSLVEKYQPAPYDGAVTLFKASVGDEIYKYPKDYGWSGLVQSLDILTIPGNHLAIFDPKNVTRLATELDKRLIRHD